MDVGIFFIHAVRELNAEFRKNIRQLAEISMIEICNGVCIAWVYVDKSELARPNDVIGSLRPVTARHVVKFVVAQNFVFADFVVRHENQSLQAFCRLYAGAGKILSAQNGVENIYDFVDVAAFDNERRDKSEDGAGGAVNDSAALHAFVDDFDAGFFWI